MPPSRTKPDKNTNTVCEVQFAGEHMLLDAQKALVWPAQSLLIVADLHIEKGSFLAAAGHAIPCYDTLDTLQRLRRLIEQYRPQELICLGDSFHDAAAHHRMSENNKTTLRELINTVDHWHWVAGNHDPNIPAELPGLTHSGLTRRNILFTHQIAATEQAQIAGHYHPKLKIRVNGQRLAGPCFVHDQQTMILPSFGSYTGGLDTSDEAIDGQFQQPPQHYLIYRDRVWKIR